jgi:tetratricopeptide (TPR) repeat protein
MYCGTTLVTGPRAVPDLSADQWVADGVRAAQAHQPEKALACFERALALSPDHHAALYNIALLHARCGREWAALETIRRLLAAAPNDVEAGRLETALAESCEAAKPLPPGRPWKSALAMVADGGPAEQWVVQATAALSGEMALLGGPEEIAACNWIVDLPPSPMSPLGRPYWNVGDFVRRGVLCHVIAKDRCGYSLRYQAQGPRMEGAMPLQHELESFGLLLHTGRLRRVVIAGRFPWPEPTSSRVAEANRRLEALGLPAGVRLKLAVVPQG